MSIQNSKPVIQVKESSGTTKPCFPIKQLPLSLIQYVLTFNSPKDHVKARFSCRQLGQSLLLGVNLHQLYNLRSKFAPCEMGKKISDGTFSTDVCIRTAMTRVLGKKSTMQSTDAGTKRYFCFSENSKMVMKSGKSVDVSSIHLDLSDIFVGGIGYGGNAASKLMARAMEMIGHQGAVYNLPVCIEGAIYDDFYSMECLSTEDRRIDNDQVREMINCGVVGGFRNINICLNINGHASLASIYVNNGIVHLNFYDSFSASASAYEKRYNDKLKSYISSLMPENIKLMVNSAKIIHILDQGAADSTGCGYYTIYTVLLLTRNEQMRLLNFDPNTLLFDGYDDAFIRADLVVRTLIHFGINRVDTSPKELGSYRRDGIFNRVPWQLESLIDQIKPRL